jgi:hypothetical protein
MPHREGAQAFQDSGSCNTDPKALKRAESANNLKITGIIGQIPLFSRSKPRKGKTSI